MWLRVARVNTVVFFRFRNDGKRCPEVVKKSCADINTHRGARTHDHKVKSLALYRFREDKSEEKIEEKSVERSGENREETGEETSEEKCEKKNEEKRAKTSEERRNIGLVATPFLFDCININI